MKLDRLPKRTRLLWQLRCAGINLIIIALCGYFYASYGFLLIAGAIITAIGLFMVLWYIPKFIKSYRINCTGDAVIIKRGVFIKTTHIMPYSRLIYTQTFTTPIAKRLGLEALVLKAARTGIIIPEMSVEDATGLLKLLSSEGNNEEDI